MSWGCLAPQGQIWDKPPHWWRQMVESYGKSMEEHGQMVETCGKVGEKGRNI
jgi:hypothetical protein